MGKHSLRSRLVLSFSIIAMISIFLLGIIQLFRIYNLTNENLSQQELAAEQLAQNVSEYINRYKAAVETVAYYISVKGELTNEESQNLLSSVQKHNPGFLNLYIGSTVGKVVWFYPERSANGELLIGQDFSDRTYFKEVSRKKKTVVSPVFQGRGGTTDPLVTIVSPVLSEKGEFKGYVLGALNLKELSAEINSSTYGEDSYPVVLDNENTVVFHPDKTFITNLTTIRESHLPKEELDYVTIPELSRREEYIALKTVPELNWKVWVGRSAIKIYLNYLYAISTTLTFMFITAIIMIGVGYVVAGRINNVFATLMDYVTHLALGNGDPKNNQYLHALTKAPTEMYYIARQFHKLAEKVSESKEELVRLNEDLERRVEERTVSLQKSNLELKVINNFIGSLSSQKDIGKFIENSLKQVEPILPYPIHVLMKQMHVSAKGIRQMTNIFDEMTMSGRGNKLHVEPIMLDGEEKGYVVVDLLERESISESEHHFIQTLANSFGILVRNKVLFENYRHRHAQLHAVLRSMSEGILFVNSNKQIIYANDFLQQEFQVYAHQREDQFLSLLEKFHTQSQQDFENFKSGIIHSIKVKGISELKGKCYFIQRFIVSTDSETSGEGYIVRDITTEEEIDFLKSNLISIASHEFKTPITSIKGSVETLLRKDANWEESFKEELLEGIHEDIGRIQELINDWLDVSKIESQSMKLVLDEVQVERMIESAIKQIPPAYLDHVTITFLPCESLPKVRMDRNRMTQVLINLITNGIRYNDSSEKILTLSVQVTDDELHIHVKDNGIGIIHHQVDKIFDRFYRVDSTATRRTGGTGLGLTISKGIVEAHQGKLLVTSLPEVGSTFTIVLPLTRTTERNEFT